MRRNVEIKARAVDFERQRSLAEALSNLPAEEIVQEDTYYHCREGRLKLRTMGGPAGELIQYRRLDRTGPAESGFRLCRIPDAAELGNALAEALGVRGIVRKTRTLLRIGRTRVHLDRVEGLGRFIELEVVLDPSASTEAGEETARDVMRALEIEPSELIEGSYIDLLLALAEETGGPDPSTE